MLLPLMQTQTLAGFMELGIGMTGMTCMFYALAVPSLSLADRSRGWKGESVEKVYERHPLRLRSWSSWREQINHWATRDDCRKGSPWLVHCRRPWRSHARTHTDAGLACSKRWGHCTSAWSSAITTNSPTRLCSPRWSYTASVVLWSPTKTKLDGLRLSSSSWFGRAAETTI